MSGGAAEGGSGSYRNWMELSGLAAQDCDGEGWMGGQGQEGSGSKGGDGTYLARLAVDRQHGLGKAGMGQEGKVWS